jgi:1-pyrroline-5-carboxylate dehydrogenase
LAVYVYDDHEFGQVLELVDRGAAYALTGAVIGTDRVALTRATEALRFTAGNFYLNDRPTGAVVGQQPFGGARASGTNDKAGSIFNLLRWTSPRSIKENLDPPTDSAYPHQG